MHSMYVHGRVHVWPYYKRNACPPFIKKFGYISSHCTHRRLMQQRRKLLSDLGLGEAQVAAAGRAQSKEGGV